MLLIILLSKQIRPAQEVKPLGAFIVALINSRQRSVLTKSNHLFSSRERVDLVVDLRGALIVVSAWVGVIAYNVDSVIAWVPVRFGRAPNPDQVV